MATSYPEAHLPPLPPPVLARDVDQLPRGEDWVYEFWWAGERVRAIKRNGGVHLLARDGRDVTNRFPRIAAAVAKLHSGNVILDGEILYLEAYSEPAVRFLAQAADDMPPSGFMLIAYDLLCDEGRDIRQFSLLCRRLRLAETVQAAPVALSPLVEGASETALAAAARLGFRGIVAKRAGSAYRPNSLSNDWVKLAFPGRENESFLRRHSTPPLPVPPLASEKSATSLAIATPTPR